MKDSIAVAAASGETGSAQTAQSVSAEQVKLLYDGLPLSQAVTIVNGAIVAFVQSYVIEWHQVAVWVGSLLVVTAARTALWAVFARTPLWVSNLARWRAYFLAGVVASAVVWGSAAFLLFSSDAVHQVFLAFVLGGMVAGAMAVLAPVYVAFTVFAVITLVPIIVRFLLVGDYISYAMAVLGAIFLLAMLAVGKNIRAAIVQSLALRFENRQLIADLRQEKTHIESINAHLLEAQDELRRSNEALESRVRERTAALQEADRRKDEFLATLSHELRNPLAPIRNAVYLLGRVDPASAQARHAIAIIERQTLHVTRLVDDLLDVTRIARGRIELRRETVDLCELVRRAVDDNDWLFRKQGIALSMSVPSTAVYADIDPTRVAQVAGNLLQNAAKFTPAPGKATIALHVDGTEAVLRVTDTGSGIEPELMPLIFQPFVQAQRTLARTGGGIGLGLALVKGIVELHGGTVRAESRGQNQGSTFVVRLPLASAPGAAGVEDAAEAESTRQRNVLVVDDNQDAANSLARLVELFGHRAEVAYDGPTALAKAHDASPDIVLCDLGLPGISGYDLARALRAQHRDIRLIAVSGYARAQDIANATRAGFDSHVAKPANPAILKQMLR